MSEGAAILRQEAELVLRASAPNTEVFKGLAAELGRIKAYMEAITRAADRRAVYGRYTRTMEGMSKELKAFFPTTAENRPKEIARAMGWDATDFNRHANAFKGAVTAKLNEIDVLLRKAKGKAAESLKQYRAEIANLGRDVSGSGTLTSGPAAARLGAGGYEVKPPPGVKTGAFSFPSYQAAYLAAPTRAGVMVGRMVDTLFAGGGTRAAQPTTGQVSATQIVASAGGPVKLEIPAAQIVATVVGQIPVAVPAAAAGGVAMAGGVAAAGGIAGASTVAFSNPLAGLGIEKGGGPWGNTLALYASTSELGQMAGMLGLPTKGTKAQLIDRISQLAGAGRREDVEGWLLQMMAGRVAPVPAPPPGAPMPASGPSRSSLGITPPPPPMFSGGQAGPVYYQNLQWDAESGQWVTRTTREMAPGGYRVTRQWDKSGQEVSNTQAAIDREKLAREAARAERLRYQDTLFRMDQEARRAQERQAAQDQRDSEARAAAVRAEDDRQSELRRQGRRKGALSRSSGLAMVEAERRQAAQAMAASRRDEMNELLAAGYQMQRPKTGVLTGRDGRTMMRESYTLTRDADGHRDTRTFKFLSDSLGTVSSSATQAQAALKATRDGVGAMGRGFIENTQHVSSWMASVWALFGALRAVQVTLKSVIDTGYQTARLDQVFTQVGGTTTQLRDDVMALAAANGRSRDEAMESAIAWSRLGYTKQQVAQAVKVSLMAANVAELDAADATRHLQAVTAAYGLQAGQLAAVLGELNAISNTWNVTNRDMLEGLGRVSAVAKQAGLPLQELMGVLGAAVGFTGQSGANIGNAVKSLTVALSNPEVQNFLKGQFGFQVSDDTTGDIKDLSTVLHDLFETYLDLTNAERQYMLVKVAGKTQASRVAAMMDSYVAGQMLAINAQLNLNSAEEENQKILATLYAQLQSVVAEYERLATIQMSAGPMQILTASAKTLRDLLAIANHPVMSTLLKGAVIMGGALAARSALTHVMGAYAGRGLTAEQLATAHADGRNARGGYFARGFAGIDRMRNAVGAGVDAQFAWARTVASHIRDGGLGATARYHALGPIFANIAKTGRAAAGAVAGLARGLAAGAIALVRMIPHLAVFYGAFKAVDWVTEKLGLSSATAAGKVDKLTEALERARAAGQAFATAGRLFDTLGRNLDTMRPNERARAIDQLTRLDPSIALSSEDAARLRSKQSPAADILRPYAERVAGLQQERLMEATAKRAEVVAVRDAEVTRLRGSPAASPAAIQAAEREASAARGEYTQAIIEESEALEQATSILPRNKLRARQQEMLLESTSAIFSGLPGSGNVADTLKRMGGIAAQVSTIDRLLAENQAQYTASKKDSKAEEDRLEALKERRTAAAKAYEEARGASYTSGSGGAAGELLRSQARAEFKQLDAEIAALSKTSTTGDLNMLAAERTRLTQAREDKQRELEAMSPALRAATVQDAAAASAEIARARSAALGTGADETERLLSRQAGLTRTILDLERAIADTRTSAAARQDAIIQALQMESDLAETRLRLDTRGIELQREQAQLAADRNREAQRGLLAAGPDAMLRKMYAFNLASRGRPVELGEYLTLSPEMRGELDLVAPQYSAEGRALRGEQARLDAARTARNPESRFADIEAGARRRRSIQDALIAPVAETLREHAAGLAVMKQYHEAIQVVTRAVDAFGKSLLTAAGWRAPDAGQIGNLQPALT